MRLAVCACVFASALIASALIASAPGFARDAAPDGAKTDIGTLQGVSYRIDIPAGWNRGLVVFYHGYSVDPIEFEQGERLSPMFDGMLERGFAVIQSAYSAAGWAVEEGYADTERLRAHFVDAYGKPNETFVAGMSMGGTLTVLTIESRPDVYDGALSLCGAIEPTDRLMQRDFALRAAFDFYFPNLMGPLVPVPADFKPQGALVRRIAAAMEADPRSTAALHAIYGAGRTDDLPPVLVDITYDIKEMQQRTHGNPFGNADMIYTGTADDFALNDGVRRYQAETAPLQAMARWYTPTGKLTRPMLALHDSGDPLVPASSAFEYAIMAQRAGHGANFVQQYVNAHGHCVFEQAQVTVAFDELVAWKRNGKRPQSGMLPSSAKVSLPRRE